MLDRVNLSEGVCAVLAAGAGLAEKANVEGRYSMTCSDPDGIVIWTEEFDNVVTLVGQNQLLVSGVTTTPAFMGLISSTGFTAVSGTDTMTAHGGWEEADASAAPEYSGNRPTLTFGVAVSGSIATTSTNSFTFTASGTVEGAFVVFGSGATDVQGATTGVLLSAGTLSTAQPVIIGNTVTVSYTLNA